MEESTPLPIVKESKQNRLKELISLGYTDYTVIKDDLYRIGMCVRCGECCKVINIRTSLNEEIATWLRMHGIKVTMLDDISGVMSWEKSCMSLKRNSKDLSYSCLVYDKLPRMCKLYPKSKSYHHTCGYIFVDKRELTWFLKEVDKTKKGK